MKKRLKKIQLSRETIASLSLSEPNLKKVAGRCYGSDYGSCLTGRCSIDYCFTGIKCP